MTQMGTTERTRVAQIRREQKKKRVARSARVERVHARVERVRRVQPPNGRESAQRPLLRPAGTPHGKSRQNADRKQAKSRSLRGFSSIRALQKLLCIGGLAQRNFLAGPRVRFCGAALGCVRPSGMPGSGSVNPRRSVLAPLGMCGSVGLVAASWVHRPSVPGRIATKRVGHKCGPAAAGL